MKESEITEMIYHAEGNMAFVLFIVFLEQKKELDLKDHLDIYISQPVLKFMSTVVFMPMKFIPHTKVLGLHWKVRLNACFLQSTFVCSGLVKTPSQGRAGIVSTARAGGLQIDLKEAYN